MHDLARAYNLSAKNLSNGLMAQANAKNRNSAAQMLDQSEGNARIRRAARTRRDQNALGYIGFNLSQGDFVIAAHDHVLAKLAQILHKVVSKRIVVVDNQDHRSSSAISIARSSAWALCTVS